MLCSTAVAMGMRVIAVDIADEKLELARKHGAEFTVNAREVDPGEPWLNSPAAVHTVCW